MEDIIDFRSDTVTQPAAGMLAMMMQAKVGLFCPSGTMTNQIAIKQIVALQPERI